MNIVKFCLESDWCKACLGTGPREIVVESGFAEMLVEVDLNTSKDFMPSLKFSMISYTSLSSETNLFCKTLRASCSLIFFF